MGLKSYSGLMTFNSYINRFNYLKIDGTVGIETFGFDRIFNQMFYNSVVWHHIRNKVISRDNGCDLGIPGLEIVGPIYIHHMNPISIEDIKEQTEILLNPDYLISTSFRTHNGIHYGSSPISTNPILERTKNDTCPWRHD